MQVKSVNESVVPKWCDHGSTFTYDAKKDAWNEYDHQARKVTCLWTRIGPVR